MRVTRSLADLDWPRTTDRLSVRPARATDAPAVFAYRSMPDVGRWMTALPDDPAEFDRGFAEQLEVRLVVEREGEIVGDLTLRVCDAWSQSEATARARGTQAELGWCLHPDHHGQGLATEAVRVLLDVSFELGLRRVEAACFAENLASRRVMEKVGLRQEGYFVKESAHRDGTWRDGVSFALLAEEWATRR